MNRTRWVAALGILVGLAACSKDPVAAGGGGAGPSSSSTTTASASSSSGQGGQGAADAGVPCSADSDCPAVEGECFLAKCAIESGKMGVCEQGTKQIGVPVAKQTPGDCLLVVCDGSGGTTTADDDADVPSDDGNDCTLPCKLGVPNVVAAAGMSCASNGGTVCDGAGSCIACNVDSDCKDGMTVCLSHACVAPSCMDGSKNGAEADVDCGGDCAGCAIGKTCSSDGDCASNACDGGGHCVVCNLDSDCNDAAKVCVTHVCIPAPTCVDGWADGSETDVDCGGPTCSPCSNGLKCKNASDCGSGVCGGFAHCVACVQDADCKSPSEVCVAGACAAPGCANGMKDGSETDVDCGGGACPACAVGGSCSSGADCDSGACDGGGICVACNVDLDCKDATKVCSAHACVQGPTCGDGIKNGAESDVDCGGPMCVACSIGAACGSGSDCASGACGGAASCVACNVDADCKDVTKACVTNACVDASTCSDHAKNGAETDVDCGGGTCPGCADGKMCNVDGDCASSTCVGAVCQP